MNNKPPKNISKTSWGGVADWYDDLLEKEDGTYQKDLILPNLLRLLAIKSGESVLDIACGQGFFTREWHRAGAKAVGFDIAKELVDMAKKHSEREVVYHVSPSHQMPFLKDESVDKATVVLALQNIEKIGETMIEAARVLKTGGKLYIVLNHPAFRIPKASSWEWDEKNNVQYRRIDSYMRESRHEIEMNPGEKDPTKKKVTISFHRPLQVYFKSLGKAGFGVTRLEEWVSNKISQPGARSEEENRMRSEIPMFICLECTKL